MNYSQEELQQIEQFASIYLKISDMAVILGIPAEVLRSDIADRTTEVSQRYLRGKAASKVKLQDDAGAGRLAAGHRECPPQPAGYGR